MSLDALALLILACLAVNLSPGPSMLLISSIAAARGFRAGILAVLGLGAGAFVHVLLAASGVAAILAASPAVFSAVRYAGAAYLIYLGIDLWRKRQTAEAKAQPDQDCLPWQFFYRGFLVDLLNPKIVVFFLAFIPQFLVTLENPGFLASVALGSVFILTGFAVNGSLAWLVAAGSTRLRGTVSDLLRRWIPGGVLIFLGLRLIWQED